MLSVCSSSTDEDLTTTGALRALVFGATTTSTAQDAQLALHIRRASRWAATYVGQPLTVQSYQETLSGFGGRKLRLERTPLRAVARLLDGTDSCGSTLILSSDFRVDNADAGFLSRDQGFIWQPLLEAASFDAAVPLSMTPRSGEETKPWTVDYVAGYTYDGVSTSSPNWSTEKGTTSTGRTLPEDIELAVLDKAQAFFEGADEVESEKLDDLEVNYRSLGDDGDGRLLTRATLLLEPYRRVV